MPVFHYKNRQMAYQDVGSGPVLLFGHSYLWDAQMWAPQIETLSCHYRCIVPDLWAHGGSDSLPESTLSLVDYADDILALMDHLDIHEFSVVGLSVGGMWGTEVALKAPQRVTSLVLMDTFIGLEPEVLHKKYFGMFDVISNAECIPEPVMEAVVPLFFSAKATDTAPALVNAFHEKLAGLTGQKALDVVEMGKLVFNRRDAFDDVEKLALPTLIMVGTEDKPRPVFESYLMNDAITGSELQVVPGAGHISNLENPEFVTQALTTFFARVYA
ncbi:alpha/beta hydrolase [Parasalinivibrio latis]|uniref:alpha/beta fold hydrolase n=1 Tax=Parasalinivibrio latis TaxID=2952610 RepID=UPI0030E2F1AD